MSRILRFLLIPVIVVVALLWFYPPARLFAFAIVGRSPECPVANAVKADENLQLQIL